jgi:hypothetical protein
MINRILFYHIYKSVILLPLPTLFRTSENEESFLTLPINASTTLYSIMGMATIRCLREGFNGRE